MILQGSRLKSSSTTVLIRCPKDLYASCNRNKQSTKRQSSSKSKRMGASPANRHSKAVRDENQDPYLLKRNAVAEQPLESIGVMRKKLRNLDFLESCLYAEVEKLQVSGSKPGQSSIKYEQSVTDYETVIGNADHLACSIRVAEEQLQERREALAMINADVQSGHLRLAELLLQLEDGQQLLNAYAQQFQDENQLVLKEIDLQQQLAHVQRNKQNTAAQLELLQLQECRLQEDQQSQRHRYFEQKANQLRVDLFEQQESVNHITKSIGKPSMRELICSFYARCNVNTKQQQGLDVWICKNELVEDFRKIAVSKLEPLKPDLSIALKKYIDILSKIEVVYRKMQNLQFQQSIAKCKTEESEFMSQYSYWVANQQRLRAQIQANRTKMGELLAQQKLYRLAGVDASNTQKLVETIQRLSGEQDQRISKIKSTRQRALQLRQSVTIKVPQEEQIKRALELKAQIKQAESNLSKQRAEYLRCDRTRRQKQNEFRSVKLSRMPGKQQQDIEAISILYKKIQRVRQKKIIIKTQISQLQTEVGNCITPKTHTPHGSRWQSHSRQQTTPCAGPSGSLIRRLQTDYHPLQETIQKLQRLKDSISERTPLAGVYSRILKL